MILSSTLFQKARAADPALRSKVVVVVGDLAVGASAAALAAGSGGGSKPCSGSNQGTGTASLPACPESYKAMLEHQSLTGAEPACLAKRSTAAEPACLAKCSTTAEPASLAKGSSRSGASSAKGGVGSGMAPEATQAGAAVPSHSGRGDAAAAQPPVHAQSAHTAWAALRRACCMGNRDEALGDCDGGGGVGGCGGGGGDSGALAACDSAANGRCTAGAGGVAGARRLPLDGAELSESPLGITDATLLAALLSETTHVLHCAARIILEDDIRDTLLANYCGTRTLLALAERMPRMRSFVYVSSAYANIDAPLNSTVEERVNPLVLGDCQVDHASLVESLMAASPPAAAAKAHTLRLLLNFPNNYTLGKRLTELMVLDAATASPRPFRRGALAIARPSFVGSISHSGPCPGYTGNLAGPAGLSLAYGLGFYVKGSQAWHDDRGMDAVPGDVASAVVLAAAAAVDAGWRPQARRSGAGVGGGSGGSGAMRGGSFAGASFRASDSAHGDAYGAHGSAHGGAYGAHGGNAGGDNGCLLVVHAASMTVNPLTNWEVSWMAYDYFKANPPRFKLFADRYVSPSDYGEPPDFRYTPNLRAVAKAKRRVARRVALVSRLLRMAGQRRAAQRLVTGHQQWAGANDPKNDVMLYFSCGVALAMEAALVEEERSDFTLVWRGDWHDYGKLVLESLQDRYLGRRGRGGRSAAGSRA